MKNLLCQISELEDDWKRNFSLLCIPHLDVSGYINSLSTFVVVLYK